MKIGVFVSNYSRYDAMCNDALEMYRTLLGKGWDCHFFVTHVTDERDDMEMSYLCDADDFLGDPENLLLFHFGLFEGQFDRVVAARCRKIFRYHNITESRFFDGYDEPVGAICQMGRDQMMGRLNAFEQIWANSYYSALELVNGYGASRDRVAVLEPFHFIEERFSGIERSKAAPGFRVLSVGRIMPHKNQKQLVRSFLLFCQDLPPAEAEAVRLDVVGRLGTQVYWDELRELCADSPVGEKVHFHCDGINEDALAQLYSQASLFFLPSLHEGFCVPVVEAMRFGVPILTSSEGALPFTVGCYGIALESLSDAAFAEAISAVFGSPELQSSLRALSEAGFSDYTSEKIHRRFERSFESLVGLPRAMA